MDVIGCGIKDTNQSLENEIQVDIEKFNKA
jgi:hypothetical protein